MKEETWIFVKDHAHETYDESIIEQQEENTQIDVSQWERCL